MTSTCMSHITSGNWYVFRYTLWRGSDSMTPTWYFLFSQ